MPTLASPASIVALRSSRGGGDDDGDGSGHRDPECLLSDIPKLLPHHRPPTIRKSRSISIVDGNNDDRTHHRPDSFASSSRSSDPSSSSPSRHESFECLAGRRRRVSFDPHITVHEFGVTSFERRGGGKWWSERELEEFKKEAIQRIRSRCATIVPTGTGRSLAVPPSLAAGGGGAAGGAGNVSFNHPALGCEDEYDPRELPAARDDAIVGHLSQEIRNILVVDPHEVFLSLFRKSLKHMIPHAAVATAQSTEEALVRIEAAQRAFPVKDGGSAHGFDVIIVEENLSSGGPTGPAHRRDDSSQSAGDDSVQRRWNMTSGSCLCCHLAESQRLYGSEVAGEGSRLTLIIGVSALLDEHRERLEKAGADCVWGKPPPEMNVTLRNDLLKTLMKKRRRRVDFRLFDAG
ncbi:hypothetical protein ACHAW5_002307 [Stephanodiscus triporus]|uniref:Response regulatory domain-containing protein n=1 Tax=Stephanodiscus triporus TaxID=2934178 RepID=A0ABD3MIS0_9STRA